MFATTRWSIVQAAGADQLTPAREAFSSLCETYWFPLYAFVRRCGHAPHEAEDYTQAFFAFVLEGQMLAAANRERGRFRSFLLKSMQNFLATQLRHAKALKRGGGKVIESLDVNLAEGRYQHEPVDSETPERVFEREWAMTLLNRVLSQLKAEYKRLGQFDQFTALEPHLQQRDDRVPLRDLAVRWSMSEEAVKSAAHRLRKRYREMLREEVAQTLTDPTEVDDELRSLIGSV